MEKCEEGELLCSSPEDQHATNGYGKKIAVAAVVALFVVAAGVAVYSGMNGAKGVQDAEHELAARRASCSSDNMIIESYDNGFILMDDNNAGNSRSANWVSYTTKAGSRWKINLLSSPTTSSSSTPTTSSSSTSTSTSTAASSSGSAGSSSGGGRRVSTRRAATKDTFSIQRVGTDQYLKSDGTTLVYIKSGSNPKTDKTLQWTIEHKGCGAPGQYYYIKSVSNNKYLNSGYFYPSIVTKPSNKATIYMYINGGTGGKPLCGLSTSKCNKKCKEGTKVAWAAATSTAASSSGSTSTSTAASSSAASSSGSTSTSTAASSSGSAASSSGSAGGRRAASAVPQAVQDKALLDCNTFCKRTSDCSNCKACGGTLDRNKVTTAKKNGKTQYFIRCDCNSALTSAAMSVFAVFAVLANIKTLFQHA